MVRFWKSARLYLSYSIAFSTAMMPLQSHAVTVRGDKAPNGISEYSDQNNTYSASGNLMSKEGATFSNSCSVTLINARTAITAAHCLINDQTRNYVDLIDGKQIVSFDPDSSGKTDASGQNDANITGFISHPGYRNGGPVENASDIAIISLDKRMDHIKVVKIADEKSAAGTKVYIVGYGTSGSIGVNPFKNNGDGLVYLGEDNKRRVVTNIIDLVGPITAEQAAQASLLSNDWVGQPAIIFDVDDPANPRSWWNNQDDANDMATEFEGGTGGGDSGGGMFKMENGELVLIGVASQGGPMDDTKPDGADSSVMQHVDVFAFKDWLASNNPLKSASWKAGDGSWFDPARWSTDSAPQNRRVACNTDEKDRNCHRSEYYDVTLDAAGKVSILGEKERRIKRAEMYSVKEVDEYRSEVEVDTININNSGSELYISRGGIAKTIGATSVNSGTLNVDGKFSAKQLDVARRGVLKGSGNITAPVNLAGQLHTNNGLNISGDVNVEEGGVLVVNLSDKNERAASISGGLDISKATLLATLDADDDGTEYRRKVVGVKGNITGQFSNVILPSPFFTHELKYLADEIELFIKRDLSSGLNNLTDRNKSFLQKLIKLNDGSIPELTAVMNEFAGLSTTEAEKALNALKGAGLSESSLSTLSVIRSLNSVINQVRGTQSGGAGGSGLQLAYLPEFDPNSTGGGAITNAFGAAEEPSNKALWFKIFGGYGNFDGSNGASNTIVQSGGVQAGLFFEADANTQYGLFAGYTNSNNSPDGSSNEVKGDHYNIGGYADIKRGDYTLSGSASYIFARQKSLRFVNVGGFNRIARADFNSHTLTGSGTIARTFVKDDIKFSPFVGAEVIASWTDGYTESGAGVANLTVSSDETVDAFFLTGINMTSEQKDAGDWKVHTELKLGARTQLTSLDNSLNASFAGQSFTTVTANTGRFSLDVGLGLVAKNDAGMEIQIRYDGQFNNGYDTHSLTAQIKLPLN